MKNVLNKIVGIVQKVIKSAIDVVIMSFFAILALAACACITVGGFGLAIVTRESPSKTIYELFDEFAETFSSDVK